MKRLTKIFPSGNYGIVGDIDDAVHRLAAIEDILGDEYELEDLKKALWCKEIVADTFNQIGKVIEEESNNDDSNMVNHPSHYNQGGIECIDAIKSATCDLDGVEAFCTGNAIKYLWRWKEKMALKI